MIDDKLLLTVAKALHHTHSKATHLPDGRKWGALSEDEQQLWLRITRQAEKLISASGVEAPIERRPTSAAPSSSSSSKEQHVNQPAATASVRTQPAAKPGGSWTDLVLPKPSNQTKKV
jgi:hypothetical protein